MVRNRFMDTVRLLKRKTAGDIEARLVNVTATTVTVRLTGEETVFSRSTGRVLRGNQDLSMSPAELAWFAPQNVRAYGEGVGHLR